MSRVAILDAFGKNHLYTYGFKGSRDQQKLGNKEQHSGWFNYKI